VQMQCAALAHLAEYAPQLPLPRVVPTVAGETWTFVPGPDGTPRLVWMLTWLPGTILAEARPRLPELLRDLGRVLGEMDGALLAFEHPRRTATSSGTCPAPSSSGPLSAAWPTRRGGLSSSACSRGTRPRSSRPFPPAEGHRARRRQRPQRGGRRFPCARSCRRRPPRLRRHAPRDPRGRAGSRGRVRAARAGGPARSGGRRRRRLPRGLPARGAGDRPSLAAHRGPSRGQRDELGGAGRRGGLRPLRHRERGPRLGGARADRPRAPALRALRAPRGVAASPPYRAARPSCRGSSGRRWRRSWTRTSVPRPASSST